MLKVSLRLKLTLLLYAIIFGLYIIMWVIVAPAVKKIIESNNSQSMYMLSKEKANELNSYMLNVERAVEVLEHYIYDNLDVEKMKTDSDYTQLFMEELTEHSIDAAMGAGNVAAIYFRPDPNVYGSTSGIFLLGNKSGIYTSTEPTDILKYPSTDREHVGWYYEPKQKGLPLWVEPYSNKNINIYMISYVIPLYTDEGEFFGVVGMDMTMSAIHKVIDNINYKDGFGFLLSDSGSIIYHPEYIEGLSSLLFDDEMISISSFLMESSRTLDSTVGCFKWHGQLNYILGANMQNGMILVISAPKAVVMEPSNKIRISLIVILFIAFVALFISIRIVMRHVVKPIAELTRAASRISKGELTVTVKYKSHDEIGQLADSVRKMSSELQDYVAYIQKIAYTDTMTNVGNKSSYISFIKNLELRLHEGMADFLIFVFDVNGLKRINDSLGHEVGDILISDAASVIIKAFGDIEDSHIFRIGGDEFAVIIENFKEADLDSLFQKYRECLAETNSQEHSYGKDLSISFGYSFANSGDDYKTVFQRADEQMYHNKENFYSGRNDRRKR